MKAEYLLWPLLLLLVILGSGCFYLGQERFEDITQVHPSKWSSRDCLTIILSAMVHNLNDKDGNVEIIATPFYPSVVMALNQIERAQYHWTEDDAKYHMDELLKGSSGLYVDWKDGRFVNARGNYFKDQTDIDSLLVVISLKNRTWPCAVPTVTMRLAATPDATRIFMKDMPLLPVQDWPCPQPDIQDIDGRIFLLNDAGDTLRPRFVWGRRHDQLTSNETLFAMFPFRKGPEHFLAHSSTARLEVLGFDSKMSFVLKTEMMR